MNKQVESGLRQAILPRGDFKEIHLTATLREGESDAALLKRVAESIQAQSAKMICLESFGLQDGAGKGRAALEAAFGRIDFPVTWLEGDGQWGPGAGGIEVWASTGGSVEPIQVDGNVLGCLFDDGDARYCRLGGLTGGKPEASVEDQTQAVIDQMLAALEAVGMTFDNVIRTWFHNRDILDWYDEFNVVRTRFFKENQVFDKLVPASTGVAGVNPDQTALIAGLLAIDPKVDSLTSAAIPSPLQCPALEYGSSFSRAVEVSAPDHKRILISGSASIEPGGKTIHLDDVDQQIVLTMAVVKAILKSRGMAWEDVSRAIGYFKYAKDVPAFERYRQRTQLPDFPMLYAVNDICRHDLLFEIELDAVQQQ